MSNCDFLENPEKSSLMSFGILQKLIENSRIETFCLPNDNKFDIQLFIQRDDLIHPEISGNKLRKLKYNLKAFFENECEVLVTFGGAFSNHLLATASAAQLLNIPVVGVVRGDELTKDSNKLLQRCHELGMNLVFESRSTFSDLKHQNGVGVWQHKKAWFVPEGGANLEGILGCEEIVENVNEYDFICLAQGTTTTSIGILRKIENSKLLVVPVLKGFDSLQEMIALDKDNSQLIKEKTIVLDQFHFGGYAKSTEELNKFVFNFNAINACQIEPVYTGKAMFALNEFLKNKSKNESLENKKVLFVHTGGLFSLVK